jgi:hypothetical protein
MRRVPVVEIRHLSPAQLKALRIADNRLAQHAHWDDRLLGENFLELKELELDFDLSITSFSLAEIDLAIQQLNDEVIVETNDETDTMIGVPVCRLGDVWQLADHRVHCGDATSEAAFQNLMKGEWAQVVFIDPDCKFPAGQHPSKKGEVRDGGVVQASGELGRQDLEAVLSSCALLAKHSDNGAIHFVCMDWRYAAELLAARREIYSDLIDMVVWVRSNTVLGSLYPSQHELIFVFKSGKGPHTNNIEIGKSDRNRTNVWKYSSASSKPHRKNSVELTPAAKPVQLVMDALLDCSNRGEVVLDSLLGNGTTLLAAQRTGRVCRGIELDPRCVDTAIRHWQNLTGREAVRLSNGRLFRDIEAERRQPDE